MIIVIVVVEVATTVDEEEVLGHVEVEVAVYSKPITRRHILDSSKLKDFADDNLKFEENGIKLFKLIENTLGKGEIARYEQFLLFL